MFACLDDTIVAISSPAGVSIRGVIRLSGPAAFALADEVFQTPGGPSLSAMCGHRRLIGRVRIDESAWVPAEAYTFRAPASYTRQDVVELHTLGAPPVLAMVLEILTTQGARQAEPGEFTARAYLAGAMDLTRAEGVLAMIHARNDSQLRASQALLHGKLSRLTTSFRDRLADLLAMIEATIDFAEEPIEFVSPVQITATIDEVVTSVAALLRDSPAVERLDVLPEVLLAGRANTGKSTLFNQLTGMDRVIASAAAGTTRDVVSAPLTVPGGEVTLLDSAGLISPLEPQEHGHEREVAELAQRAARKSLASADLILLVIDATGPCGATDWLTDGMPMGRPVCVVANKMDMLSASQRESWLDRIRHENTMILVSALTGEGVDALRGHIGQRLFAGLESHGAELLALSNRQRGALRDAHDALCRARAMCDESSSLRDRAELVALEVHEAMDALSLLVGAIVTEDMLDRIFSRFCIGK